MVNRVIYINDAGRREAVHLLQCRSALKIEVSTGLKHSRGSVLRLVQDKYGIKARTKKAAIKEIEQKLRDDHNFDVVEGHLS